jgi:phosphoribosyl 1,2-cyclic phosphodiesterase
MRLVFLGTGPTVRLKPDCDSPICKAVKAKKYDSKDYRRNFSIFLSNQTKILLDASLDVEDQVERFKVPLVNYILISHAHRDHSGGIKKAISLLKPEAVYMHEATFDTLRKKYGNIPLVKFLKPNKRVALGDIGVFPFLFSHAIIQKTHYPTFGFIFFHKKKRIVIIPDYILDYQSIIENAINYIRGCDLLVTNGSTWKKPQFGGVSTAIRNVIMAKKWKVKKVILTHIGHTAPTHDKANQEIKKIWSKAEIAYDGMEVRI